MNGLKTIIQAREELKIRDLLKLKKELDQACEESDPVNHPAHYCQGNIECIDAIAAATKNLRGIEAVCVANIIKYSWRYKEKNGVEDLQKARFYLNHLIDHLEPFEVD